MRLEGARGPHEGSLEATFGCPRCGHKIVLLTNPWETQLVKVLGVKIGGRATPTSPYEQVLGNLAVPREEVTGNPSPEPSGPGCPFAGMFGQEEVQVPEDGIGWTDEARLRIERIPSFIRPMVQKAIERYAKEQGHRAITDAVMDEARSRLGM
ncbi:MAG: PCP reductase family protein [Nitrospinae bacterium]|nr:PCP reductase family protein [Nitrospinota bacterium]